MPNFVAIGHTFAEMRQFFDFENNSRPPSVIFRRYKFLYHVGHSRRHWIGQVASCSFGDMSAYV